jgi:hypothetical protein
MQRKYDLPQIGALLSSAIIHMGRKNLDGAVSRIEEAIGALCEVAEEKNKSIHPGSLQQHEPSQEGGYSAHVIGCTIAAALVKIGSNDLNGAVGRLQLSIQMVRGLQKQKSQRKTEEQK